MAINADTLAEESKALATLNARLDDKTRRLVTAWAITWDQVAGELEAAITELAAATDDGRVTRTMILRSQRLQAALAAVGDSLGLVVAQTNQIITDDIRQGIEDAITAAERMLATQLPAATAQVGGMLATQATVGGLTVGVVAADPVQVTAMVTRVTQRITKTTYPLAVEAQAAIRRELLRGIAVGANPRVSARRALRGIEDQWNGGLTRALTIARTETIDAHRAAAQVVHTANRDIVDRWEWTAHLDKRTCRACIAMHGERFDVTTPGPLGHQNCRCARVPVTKTWEELGFTGIKEPKSLQVDKAKWFNKLKVSDQRAILGDRGFDAWQAGVYPMDQWVKRQENTGWRDSYVTTPAPKAA